MGIDGIDLKKLTPKEVKMAEMVAEEKGCSVEHAAKLLFNYKLEEPGDTFHREPNALGVVGGAALIGGAIAGPIGAGVGVAIGVLTSCDKDNPTVHEERPVDVTVVNINVASLPQEDKDALKEAFLAALTAFFGTTVEDLKVDFKALLNKINELNNNVNTVNDNVDKVLTSLSDIINNIKNNGGTLAQIYKALVEQGADIKTIIALLKLTGQSLDEILKAVKDNGVALSEILIAVKDNGVNIASIVGLLTAQGYDIKEILAEMKKLNINVGELSAKITENHKDLTALVKQVLEAANKANDLSVENNRLLGLILDKISNLPSGGGADVKNIEAILKQMLEQLLKAVQNGEELKELVINNNNISQEISNKLDGLGDSNKEILVQLKAGNAKLDDIVKLLKSIDKTTTSMDTKLAVVAATVNNLYDDFKAYGPEVMLLLTEILAKIPPGCDCHDFDPSAIIELLAEIKVIIEQKGGDKNHEGILDDLDDLFG